MRRTFQETTTDESSEEEAFHRGYHGRRADQTWDEVLAFPRVLLVAEAGAGKSYECEQQAKLRFARGDAAFYLRLENVVSKGVARQLRPKQRRRFDKWLKSSSLSGYFFLDSVDELQLVHGSFRAALERLADDIEGALSRAVIVVTSRPVQIDREAFEDILPVPPKPAQKLNGAEFVRIAMRSAEGADGQAPKPVTIKEFTLLPLAKQQLLELAKEHRVAEPEKLLQQIEAKNAHEIARWPQELIELCDDWRLHGVIRPHRDQLESHIRARLTARTHRRERADLSYKEGREGSQRLALGVMLCRRLSFRLGEVGDIAGSDIEPVDPKVLLDTWTVPQISALLQRPLFGPGGYGRARFRHRSVVEYLAAYQIHDQIESGTLSLSSAKRLLFAIADTNDKITKPSMRPVAAWLALIRKDIFEAMLEVDPGSLLTLGDPESLEPTQCQRALSAFVRRHGQGQWQGIEVPPLQISRLAAQPLGETILHTWAEGIQNPEIKQLLLRLVAEGRYQACSDLAVAVAQNQADRATDRFEALVALSRLSDERLEGLIEAAVSGGEGWPKEIGRWVGIYLYPERVTDDQMLKLLGWARRESKRHLDYADSVARVIEKADLSTARLLALLPGLKTLMLSLLVRHDDQLIEPEHGLRVSHILRAACKRLLGRGVRSDEVLQASVAAFRVAGTPHDLNSGNKELAKLFVRLPLEDRRRLFEADLAWIESQYPDLAAKAMFFRMMIHDGPQTFSFKRDWAWVVGALSEQSGAFKARSVLLYLAIHLAPMKNGSLSKVKALRLAVVDEPQLAEQLEELIEASRPNPEHLKWQADYNRREEKRLEKAQKEKKAWLEVWRQLAKKPSLALSPEKRDNTIWNIGLALRNRPKSQEEVRWDRPFLERCFGAKVVDDLRNALCDYWRSMRPTVASEREAGAENTYLVVWSYGLMGIYAEVEDPNWATNLSADEAALAARYALIQLNGYPSWLAALSDVHRDVVEAIIGNEIEGELSGVGGPEQWHSMHLQSLRYASTQIARMMEPRLLAWLRRFTRLMRGAYVKASESRLEQVFRVLRVHGDASTRSYLAELATREAAISGDGPYAKFWISALCRTDPHRGVQVLLSTLDRLPVGKDGKAVAVIGQLFDERTNGDTTNWRAPLSPDERRSLVTALYRHVRPEDDIEHLGVYSPGARDHAEDARRIVFNELMESSGSGAVDAKLTLTASPNFAHMRDRIKVLARERLAVEIDASIFVAEDLAKMLSGRELSPKTGSDMAYLLIDRLDDLQELMLRDTAPRAAWAMVNDENALRPAIARELEIAARGSYTVDQEAVTADGKETDIRLRALAGNQATIELKVGEKDRSGSELRFAIEDQLVKKYMAHAKARTGCFMVTVADPKRRWDHPDTKEKLDRFGLQRMLEEAAQLAQQRLGGDARVLARVLDLTPRLGAEEVTKKKPARKPASKRARATRAR